MFSQNGKGRAVHLVIFAPNSKIADKITEYFKSKGRIDYDGRPIFGISCRDLVKDLKEIEDKIEIIPAHALTPWFGLFGSKSGFNSLKECFEDQTDKIYAVESGISADPEMLWGFEEFKEGKIKIVSFSDAHCFWPWRIGRECTIFNIPELSYDNIMKAIRTGDGLNATIETPPSYGKYHYDGHRVCGFSSSPEETKKLNGICPVCKKSLTIGVDYRVEEISKESKGYKPKNAKPYHSILPLHELIAFNENTSLSTKKVWNIYNPIISDFKNEFNVLLKVSKEGLLEKNINEKLVKLIMLNREGNLNVKAGYDGEYGKIVLEDKQKTLI